MGGLIPRFILRCQGRGVLKSLRGEVALVMVALGVHVVYMYFLFTELGLL